MQPPPTPLLSPDSSTDMLGVLFMVIIPSLIGLLTFSQRAQQVAQFMLNAYKFYRSFREQMQGHHKPHPSATNGNGNGHTNGNGNGNGNGTQSDLLKSVMHNLRVESDARESGDENVKAELREVKERGRRDSDNFYMLYSELKEDDKKMRDEIGLVKIENAALRSQMTELFKNDAEMNTKLDSILHLLRRDDSGDSEAALPKAS